MTTTGNAMNMYVMYGPARRRTIGPSAAPTVTQNVQ